jgi:transposase
MARTPSWRTGHEQQADRRTLNGILYALRTGYRWKGLPDRYGSSVTCCRRLDQWQMDGTWGRIWRAFLTILDEGRAFLEAASY